MSHGLKGESPFYCHWHFRCDDPRLGDEIMRQSLDWDGTKETYFELRRAEIERYKERRQA